MTRPHAIEAEIATRPVEVSVRHIDRHRFGRAARCRIHAERAGVTEQIQKAFAGGLAAHLLARVAMIQKEAGIQIGIQIHDKLQTVFLNDEILALAAGFFVLLGTTLAAARLERNVAIGNAQH